MARQVIDIGTRGNDGTGDSIRESFKKVNANFGELYAAFGVGGKLLSTNLADFPEEYNANQILVTTSTGTKYQNRTIKTGVGIVVDLSVDHEITFGLQSESGVSYNSDDITEGSLNKYYTDFRAISAIENISNFDTDLSTASTPLKFARRDTHSNISVNTIIRQVSDISSNISDHIIVLNNISGIITDEPLFHRTLLLPLASDFVGQESIIVNRSSEFTITIQYDDSTMIATIGSNSASRILSDGYSWYVI